MSVDEAPLCQHGMPMKWRSRPRSIGGGFTCRCAKDNQQTRGFKHTEDLNKLKLERGGACEKCGYDAWLPVLGFHHRDPSTKLFQLSDNTKRGPAKTLEAAKCDLLCANCHLELERGYDG